MTEAEWLACIDPIPMLESLRSLVSARKLRLFACACYREIWPLLLDPRCRQAVEIAELFADGRKSEEEIQHAQGISMRASFRVRRIYDHYMNENAVMVGGRQPTWTSLNENVQSFLTGLHAGTEAAVQITATDDPAFCDFSQCVADIASTAVSFISPGQEAKKEHGFHQCNLLRDITGNPFRPVTLENA